MVWCILLQVPCLDGREPYSDIFVSGTMEEMKTLVELDLFIGVNGCSLKTEENLKVIKEIPNDKIMIETDAPWCDIR